MLDEARQFIAQNELNRAEALLRPLLEDNERGAEAHHLLGVVAQERGEQEEAIALMQRAIELDPRQPAYYNNLGHSFRLAGDLESASQAFQRAVALQPGFALAFLNLGIVQHHLGQPRAARDALDQALQHNPRMAGAMHYLGLTHLVEGDTAAARRAFEQALAVHPGIAESELELARLNAREDEPHMALARLQRVINARPGLALAWRLMGELRVSSGEDTRAEACFRRALENHPEDTDTLGALGDVLMRQGRYEEALTIFERVLELDPARTQAHSFRASCFERMHRLADAEEAVRQALAINPELAEASVQQAVLAQRRKDLPRARQILESLRARDDLYDDLALAINQQLGVVLDRLDEPRQAFAAFTAANSIGQRVAKHIRKDGMFNLQWLEMISAWAMRSDFSQLDATGAGTPTPRPAFLVGFPRSGTTLLGQVLAAHSAVRTADEIPALQPFLNRHALSNTLLDALLQAPAATLEGERRTYHQTLMDTVNDAQNAQVLVDKMPLYAAVIGPIRCLFPSARFVVVLRDPRDVCLSCFMQNFKPNTAMLPFLELETTAEYYSRVMDLVIQYLELFPEHIHVVRYEDIVADLEATATPMFGHLGLEWEQRVAQYHQTAREEAIHTPSYRQVTEPLYARAAGRWERYREELAPVLPRLEPYVQRFGYG